MHLYASTFISGMQDVVRAALVRRLPDVRIHRMEDGIVLFESEAPAKEVGHLRFCNNTFAVCTLCDIPADDPLKHLVKAVRDDDALDDTMRRLLPKKGSCTIMTSIENSLTQLPPILREKLMKRLDIACPLPFDRRDYSVELWLMTRSEGFGFFGVRLERDATYDQPLQKGELRPELAHMLCLLSEPKPDDVFLDPFCGSGAIALERARAFAFREIHASDSDALLTEKLQARVTALKLPVQVSTQDALHLRHDDQSIDVIVTDPPWGIFEEKNMDYARMFRELVRVMKPGGRIVLLLSRAVAFDSVLQHSDRAKLQARYDVLVSGQKATVFVISL